MFIGLEVARPVGLEPTTPCLEGRCSIQLSYGRVGLALPYFRTFGACAGKLCDWRVNFVESLRRKILRIKKRTEATLV